MINPGHRAEAIGRMTILTGDCCLDVRRRLTGCRCAVVAAYAIAGDGAVVDPGVRKTRRGMTIVT